MRITQPTSLETPDLEATADLERRIYAAMHRTPEQIASAQEKAEKFIHPGRPLPNGKTLEEVFVGTIEDNLTEEEVIQALMDA